MVENSLIFICIVIAVALIFDFINGFHDAANSIATVVSTRVLRPQTAVLFAAFFNFVAFFVFGSHVANMIGKGVVDPAVVDSVIVMAALFGAIAWDIITWYYGIPSSSSHALIGGLSGAVIAKAGVHALQSSGLIKIAVSIILSPVLGFVLAYIFMTIVAIFSVRSTLTTLNSRFRKLQLVSASLYSLGHGGNDAQKTMGIITVLLFSTGMLKGEFHVPLWVALACYIAMALGTLSGGWRIVRTMGMKITKLQPVGGFCAETGGAITLFLATALGIPVSTTHTITGSIMGVGAVTKFSAVRWGVAEKIVWAWILTVPASAFISILCWWILHFIVKSIQ